MNRIAFFPDSAAKTKEISKSAAPDHSEDFEDSDHEESLPYLTGGRMGGTQFSRLIDASCKAFFLRRGLDPDADRSPALAEVESPESNAGTT
jgi:hypothetical protein